jgi:hypothetical protein
MAISNIINTLLPSFAHDSVAVFTQDFTQIFRNARALKAVVKEQSKVMQHPVESGIVITDHRIILPIEIELSLILAKDDYQSVYQSIRGYYLQGTLLVVQTRSGVYQNMLIQQIPHEENPDMYNALTVAMTLRQVLFAVAQYGVVPKYAKNSTTQAKGSQLGTKATTNQTALASMYASKLGGNSTELLLEKEIPRRT